MKLLLLLLLTHCSCLHVGRGCLASSPLFMLVVAVCPPPLSSLHVDRGCLTPSPPLTQVLNDTWVSFPSWSEDSNPTTKKNTYEEYLSRAEDERFQVRHRGRSIITGDVWVRGCAVEPMTDSMSAFYIGHGPIIARTVEDVIV